MKGLASLIWWYVAILVGIGFAAFLSLIALAFLVNACRTSYRLYKRRSSDKS